jgi:hypothetical protein
MDFAIKHSLREKRERIFVKGWHLIEGFLNNETIAPSKRQLVMQLLARYGELQGLLPQILKKRPLGRQEGTSCLIYDLTENPQLRKCIQDINRLLEPFTFRAGIGRYVFVGQDQSPRIATEIGAELVGFSKQEVGIDLSHAVALVMQLAEEGETERLRQCPNCQRWFFGRPDKECCTDACYRASYRRRPKFKEKNAAYMRKRRKRDRLLLPAKQRGQSGVAAAKKRSA